MLRNCWSSVHSEFASFFFLMKKYVGYRIQLNPVITLTKRSSNCNTVFKWFLNKHKIFTLTAKVFPTYNEMYVMCNPNDTVIWKEH